MNIFYFGHSAFALAHEGHVVYIDPFLSGNPHTKGKAFPSGLDPETIIVTHGHGDHVGDAPQLSKRFQAPIVAVFELASILGSQGCSVVGCGAGGRVDHSWGWSRFVPAFHSSNYEGRYAGNAVGVVLNIGGVTVYHSGDTCVFGDMKLIGELYHPDIALLPIGSHFTMDVYEAAAASKMLGAKYVVPMHYNTFPQVQADPQEFKRLVEAQGNTQVQIMPAMTAWEPKLP